MVLAGVTQRKRVSSSSMSAEASLNSEGVQRRKGLVNVLPFSSCRPDVVGVEHYSQVLPHMS